jgi:hypothetical protein
MWHPEAAPIAALRQAIDRRSRQFKDVLSDENIRKDFLKGTPKNDSKVVKAFVAANASNALKTRPKVSYSVSFFLASPFPCSTLCTLVVRSSSSLAAFASRARSSASNSNGIDGRYAKSGGLQPVWLRGGVISQRDRA